MEATVTLFHLMRRNRSAVHPVFAVTSTTKQNIMLTAKDDTVVSIFERQAWCMHPSS
jgi:hypothetical protein